MTANPIQPDWNSLFHLQNTEQAGARSESRTSYRVDVPVFEGPLDLLLHLIRKEEINIYDIPIAKICQSYLDTIDQMQQPDVNLAGEFLVMAATLMHIKSAYLLPRDETLEAEDPRLPLVQQLLEYERFQRAAQTLDKIPWLYRELYPRPPTAQADLLSVESFMDAPIEPVDMFQLLICLKAAMNRTYRPPLEIETDRTSIKEKVTALTLILDQEPTIQFSQILPPEPQPSDIIISFLAVLELARLKYIEVLQSETFGPILIRATRPLSELNASLLDQY